MLAIHPVNAGEDVEQNLGRWLGCVNCTDPFLAVIAQHRLRFLFVGFQSALDNLLVGVIEPVIFERALL